MLFYFINLFFYFFFVPLSTCLDLSSLPFSIAKLPFHLTFVPFYLLVHTELFLFAFLCNIDVLFSGNNIFSLFHDFVLFPTIVLFHFSLCLFLIVTASWHLFCAFWCNINAVFMKHIAPQVCPFSSQLCAFISLSLPSSDFLLFLALFLVSINAIMPSLLCNCAF